MVREEDHFARDEAFKREFQVVEDLCARVADSKFFIDPNNFWKQITIRPLPENNTSPYCMPIYCTYSSNLYKQVKVHQKEGYDLGKRIAEEVEKQLGGEVILAIDYSRDETTKEEVTESKPREKKIRNLFKKILPSYFLHRK